MPLQTIMQRAGAAATIWSIPCTRASSCPEQSSRTAQCCPHGPQQLRLVQICPKWQRSPAQGHRHCLGVQSVWHRRLGQSTIRRPAAGLLACSTRAGCHRCSCLAVRCGPQAATLPSTLMRPWTPRPSTVTGWSSAACSKPVSASCWPALEDWQI